VTIQSNTDDTTNANAIRHTFSTNTPARFVATSAANAEMVHSSATPSEINSPKYAIRFFFL
jgi:hypothetical protein